MFSWINIELTNKCNKVCYMCGRREIEKEFPKLYTKEMDLQTLQIIKNELPPRILIQFHRDGEPLLYSRLKQALSLFAGHIRCLDTNGILLNERREEIINNLEILTLSTFEDDPLWKEQYQILLDFLEYHGQNPPRVIIRELGNVGMQRHLLYKNTGCTIVRRAFRSKMGNIQYTGIPPIPETGICQEILNHPAIDIEGNVYICVRFDPFHKGMLGNIHEKTLEELWFGEKRRAWLQSHISGKRNEVPLCQNCDYWGIPLG